MSTIKRINEFTGDYNIGIKALSKKVDKEKKRDLKKLEKMHGDVEQIFANMLGMLSRYNPDKSRRGSHGAALVKASSSIAQLVGSIVDSIGE